MSLILFASGGGWCKLTKTPAKRFFFNKVFPHTNIFTLQSVVLLLMHIKHFAAIFGILSAYLCWLRRRICIHEGLRLNPLHRQQQVSLPTTNSTPTRLAPDQSASPCRRQEALVSGSSWCRAGIQTTKTCYLLSHMFFKWGRPGYWLPWKEKEKRR